MGKWTGALVVGFVGLALAVSAKSLHAQAPAARANALAFDVTSVKTNTSGDDNVDMTPSSNGVVIHNYTLQFLMRTAFRVQDEQILDGPEWLTKARFDIAARSDTPFPREELRFRLQSLLADRFRLRTHTETRIRPVYALTRSRGDGRLGPRVQVPSSCVPSSGASSSATACSNKVVPGHISGKGATASALALNLSVFAGRTVVDRTGIVAPFDYDLEWSPEASAVGGAPSLSSDGLSLFGALQEQLGLKLEASTGPVDVLAIDHVERPTED